MTAQPRSARISRAVAPLDVETVATSPRTSARRAGRSSTRRTPPAARAARAEAHGGHVVLNQQHWSGRGFWQPGGNPLQLLLTARARRAPAPAPAGPGPASRTWGRSG